jgi:hypothetical protein
LVLRSRYADPRTEGLKTMTRRLAHALFPLTTAAVVVIASPALAAEPGAEGTGPAATEAVSTAGPSTEAPPASTPAPAAESVSANPIQEPIAEEEEEEGPSLTLDLGLGSAYVWRGANVWGNRTSTQHFSLFPSVAYANGDFTAFYWGAYQVTGRDKGFKLDAGYGAEQDLGVSYSVAMGEQLSALFAATLYLYPLAKEDVAGTALPATVEPAVTLAYEGPATFGLAVSYFRGLQDSTDTFSHIYLSPLVSKDLELSELLTLTLGASAGYKLWTNSVGQDADENDFDVQANVGVTYTRGDLYVTPALHASWSDIEDNPVAAWGTVNVGYGISL